MLQIRKKVDLKSKTTFAVSATADCFIRLDSVSAIQQAIPQIKKFQDKLVLGGGSNILFVGDYSGLILYPQLFGVELLLETDEMVRVSVGASENWHQWVLQATEKGWYGLENLALIPGTVGASPVQNIGAYGVEVKQLIHKVECVDLNSGKLQCFTNHECEFAYRDSLFKRAGQGRYLVTRVEFNLSKIADLNLSYQPLIEFFDGNYNVTPKDVLERVCQIRQQRLPDPAKLANAGSFFKNPVVDSDLYEKLKLEYPDIAAYPNGDNFKLAAAWLIDRAGFKGKRFGNVGVHEFQALVLVNFGESNGEKNGPKLKQLAEIIQKAVFDKYAVHLEAEVRIEGVQIDDNQLENVL